MKRLRPSKTKTREGSGLLRFVLIVAVIAWIIRSLVFAPFSIPSGSMLPTLYVGDYLLVAKWPYGFSRYSFPFRFPSFEGRLLGAVPDRGDVVIFVPPGSEGSDFVKRVIGLPGDSVEVRDGRVILNGRPLARGNVEPFPVPVSANSPCRLIGPRAASTDAEAGDKCLYPSYREILPNGVSYRIFDQMSGSIGDSYPATTVPAGHVFLMGDNRDDSLDSRFSAAEGGIGFVPVDRLVGRATTIFWSTDGSAEYAKPWTWFSGLRSERIGTSLEPHRR